MNIERKLFYNGIILLVVNEICICFSYNQLYTNDDLRNMNTRILKVITFIDILFNEYKTYF